MSKTTRFGTRGSDLARWQTQHVLRLLGDESAEVQIFTTKGDQVLDKPLPVIGGKGLFTAELEDALRRGEIDFAVHSLKDLPTEIPAGLRIGAVPLRANPADALISKSGYTFESLPKGAVVGTSSLRRASQLLHHRPDLQIRDIRGNVDTRVRKALDAVDGQYDAILLAYAGLERLGLTQHVTQSLSFDLMLPAPGQGALAVQCRDEAESLARLDPIHHSQTALAVSAERAFLAGLGGGCAVPVAAYATIEGETETLTLRGRVCSTDGRMQIDVSSTQPVGGTDAAYRIGIDLAQEAMTKGAAALL